jgi:hypothetical protein
MENNGGLNTEEVKAAMEAATTEEDRRYLERVLESRGVRKAVVSSHEVVAGNPDAYPENTVKMQEDLALGRPHSPVSPDELGVRGSVPAPADESKAPKASGNKADK